MKICKFCGLKVNSLIDCHLIPKAFYKYTKKQADNLGAYNQHMLMVTNTKNQQPRSKIWIGWYDKNLVCSKCEKIFTPYDDYAIQILLKKEKDHKPLISKKDVVAWKINNYNYAKLKLFIIAVMWRLGASNLPQFKKINLESDLDKARYLIINNNSGNENDFSFVLARFADLYGQAYFADPHPEFKNDAFGDLNAYRVYLGAGYVVYIKVDERPFPKQTQPFVATNRMPLWILRREDFTLSKEMKAFRTVLFESNKMLEALKNRE